MAASSSSLEKSSFYRIVNSMQGSGTSVANTGFMQETLKQGWLKKQGGVVKSWHNRWFTLKGDQLYYYTSENESKMQGTIFLPGNKVLELPRVPNEPEKFLFEITTGDKSRMTLTHESYMLCASSEDERKSWMLAIKKVIYGGKGGAIFGSSLHDVLEFENRESNRKVPRIVEKCVEFLVEEGLDIEGIFRLPGRSSLIKELREEFDCGEDPPFIVPDVDVHSVASLLKLYLRELPEPLIPVQFYESVMKVVTRDMHTNHEQAVKRLCTLLTNIPRNSYNLLQYVCHFLNKVSQKSDVNKMSPMNLATVFVHSVIRPEDEDPALLMGTANGRTQVTFLFISEYHTYFKVEYTHRGASVKVDNLLDLDIPARDSFNPSTALQQRVQATNLQDLLGLDGILENAPNTTLPSPLVSSPEMDSMDLEATVERQEQKAESSPPEPPPRPNRKGSTSSLSKKVSLEGSESQDFQSNDSLDTIPHRRAPAPPLFSAKPHVPARPDPTKSLVNLGGEKNTVLQSKASILRPKPTTGTNSLMKDKTIIGNVPLRAAPLPPNLLQASDEEDEYEEDEEIEEILSTDTDTLSMQNLQSHVRLITNKLSQQRSECATLRATLKKFKELHCQQVQSLSGRIDQERQATADAIERVVQLQTRLQEYQLKYGMLDEE